MRVGSVGCRGSSHGRPAIDLHAGVLLFQAIVLGLLQGLTEFLPVSSSGHLQGVPFLLGWDTGSLAFDVLVHAGTLLAVVWYFRTDLLGIAAGALNLGTAEERRRAWVLIGLLAAASLPAAAAGLLFGDVFEAAFASPIAVAGFLYVTAIVLWSAETVRSRRLAGPTPPTEPPAVSAAETSIDDIPPAEVPYTGAPTDEVPADATEAAAADATEPPAAATDDVGRDMSTLRVRDVLTIGTAQALAIFPGISRSGATIATGMALGMSRTAAARFSFLMAVPVILGATVLTAGDLDAPVEAGVLPFGPVEVAAGVLAATLSGYWAIHTLLRIVQRRDLLGFARYVVVFATVLLAASILRP